MKKYKSKLPEITLKYKTGETRNVKITSSTECYALFNSIYDADTLEYNESCICLFLNRANNTIGWFKVSQGGLHSTVIDNRMILVTALNCGASSIILSHNHPSGNINPSDADIYIVKKLKNACELLDITLLDNFIITADNYYSFADNHKL